MIRDLGTRNVKVLKCLILQADIVLVVVVNFTVTQACYRGPPQMDLVLETINIEVSCFLSASHSPVFSIELETLYSVRCSICKMLLTSSQ